MTDAAAVAKAEDLADGEWHRLHPATPLLRGGIAFVAIVGIVIANLRERIVDFFVPEAGRYGGDPIDLIERHHLIPVALLVVLGVLLLILVVFYLSWRVHTFRITDDEVEVRSGILFRTNRKGRLDRVQGVDVTRQLLPRVFGAARLEIKVAGQDANVNLAYLSSRNADALRRVILRRASGVREQERAAAQGAPGATAAPRGVADLLNQRAEEFVAPELDPSLAPPTSVVQMHPGRLVGSTVLSSGTLWFLGIVAVAIVAAFVFHVYELLFAIVPTVFALGSVLVRRVTKSLRYSIAGTSDGVRVGYGLLSLSNETLPPGRIHSIQVSQELLWRPFDWWEVRVNLASRSRERGQEGRRGTSILPVGSRAEALKVVQLALPELLAVDGMPDLVAAALDRARPGDGFTVSPPRARIVRWFSRRRNGFALRPEAVLLRRGAIWRDLVMVPTARMQSVAIHQGPFLRALRLATVHVHTVQGPINARIGGLDQDDAVGFFRDAAEADVVAAAADSSHRWNAARPRLAPPQPHERRPELPPAPA
ncbi:PH domain-containing protein [Pseudolysinimonas sp.]|uniref:PH domain-containing protein n=1 Tax=Pseudolysinimonas sp. TaxID=2680009 RepID=UPI003F813C11